MRRSVGLDFGTTNSAIAVVDDGAPPQLAAFRGGSDAHTFPSVLYFAPAGRGTARALHPETHAGHAAIEAYRAAEVKGRFIQSLKAYLAEPSFDGTAIGGRKYAVDDLVTIILKHLRREVVDDLGELPPQVLVGRPVMFSNARDAADNEVALMRLRRALATAGFAEVAFEYEPVAAAYAYEQRLQRDELILIGDFGGGTSDFTIIGVGPGRARRARVDDPVVGTEGVALAGDAFDKQIVRHLVAPRLGRGSQYLSPPDKFLDVPNWPYANLERWHYLSFLKTPEAIDMLERIVGTALIPERIEAFLHLIRDDLGFEMHRAVQRAKFALSGQEETVFEFRIHPVQIQQRITRQDFTGWIHEELDAIRGCLDRLLTRTGTAPDQIDRVFLTGGSSFVPAVRQIFIDRFGAEKITGGHELTSVATGLALCAAREAQVVPA
ncbi:MAG: Hsp70 family protein [Vicinamibacterales bacterium]